MDQPKFEPGPVGDEGWFADPYGRHERRWFSGGSPTSLVGDGDRESHDDPPGPLDRHPERLPAESHQGGPEDLRRADEAEADSFSAPDLIRADHPVAHPDAEDVIEAALEGGVD